jgi:tryptophan synthase beta chain
MLKTRTKDEGSGQEVKLRGGFPNERGRFGRFGGRFVPETLMSPVLELEAAYLNARRDPEFQRELDECLRNYVGRPTPLFLARRLSQRLDCRVYLKR